MWIAAGAGGKSFATALARERGLQGRVMWFDAEANLWELSTREGAADAVARCKAANINTIVVDVKPLSGLVLYQSKIAPRLTNYGGREYPVNYDVLSTVLDEGRKAGIAVHAAINVFSEGSQKVAGGPALDHVEWQTVQYERGGTSGRGGRKRLVNIGSCAAKHNAVFVNPLHPEVRRYALSVISEICRNYPIDGLVLDRMRYPNIYSDFSSITRQAFESCIGQKVKRWPEDVYERGRAPDQIIRGPLFKSWLKFRAKVMHDFLAEAREQVKAARPNAVLGIYVGSWYPLYYDVGVNWGSPRYKAALDWWPEGYEETGFADLVDYIMPGCYYPHPTRKDAVESGDEEWKSVEAAAEESLNAVRDDTFVYGGLYLLQYQGSPERFRRAVDECLKKTQGCMFFDLVYVREYDWWGTLKDAFPTPTKAPHEVPGLLTRIRSHVSGEAGA